MKLNPQKLRNFKPSRTWLVLGVALAIGLLAALAARSYLSRQMAAIEARAKGSMANVIVAKANIAKGTKLSASNVAVRPIPLEFAHSLAVTPDSFDQIDGQVLAYPINAGEMILWGSMEGKKVPTFSARIDAGRRAMTVPVDEINSISGMLEPGDIMDLMVSIDQKGKKITFPLLQSVEVMATGQRSVDDPKSGERRQYSTVTIETTPEQAQNVIVAREVGKLTALLRNPQDKSPMGNTNYDIEALLGLKGNAKGVGNGDREIPVIYGGSSTKPSPDATRLSEYPAPPKPYQATNGIQAPFPPMINKGTASKL